MPAAIAILIWCCAYLNLAGSSLLSALHELNPTGYAVALLIGLPRSWSGEKDSQNVFHTDSLAKTPPRFSPSAPGDFFLHRGSSNLCGGAVCMRRTIMTPSPTGCREC